MNKSYKRKTEKCICHQCGLEFDKPTSEIKRNLDKGRLNFCGRRCVGLYNTEKLINNHSGYDITKHSNNRKDEFTGFRDLLRRVKQRNYEFDIDLEYLKELWERQNICVYTGVKLSLPKINGCNDKLKTASIDRVDSSQGYVKGNIQYISIAANLAKNSMTHEEMISFCEIIYLNKKTPSKDEV